MFTLSVVLARVKRKGIERLSGEWFLGENDILGKIDTLRSYTDQQFLFGIYSSEQLWTVISVNFIYSQTNKGLTILRLDTDTEKLVNHFRNNDFSSDAELYGLGKVWLGSSDLCQQILNITMLLEKIPCGTVLE